MRFRRSKPADDRVAALDARVSHLESMIEGLQDSVHRNAVRTDAKLDDMKRQLDPAELSRALSAEQRRRGT
jgi:uncharacterized coiled-coil protein SlyX